MTEIYTLPDLPYDYSALEPVISGRIMELHHDKHHAAYVANLNKAVTGRAEVAGWTLDRLVRDLAAVPEDLRAAVRNHGGGHYNHSLLWTSLAKSGAKQPSGELAKAVEREFGAFEACREKLSAAALSVFGSGWAWLSCDAAGALRVETTPNQDSPLTAGRTPLVGIDVWEHAYYLRYQNRRAEYVAAFANVVNWEDATARYRDARAR